MQEDYLDQRLIGRQFTLSTEDLTGGATFYGILYRLRAAEDLHVGDRVEVIRADQHGLTVRRVALKEE
ncbi:NfeD family protein [Levilactobacillus spicheri]|uniref:Transporter-associated domain-containing protein n=2 Tax=Levilactobacillus spicheri TaxID=216463 RepID=A0ABQ0WSH4_9LACO|nr:hypothetical protein [Levilactobacillus spicheri]KRL48106.1 hypothetical protein FD37_GL001667 [Levilactobacillus spicheri DSM 15429]GEO68083.1 hypothetical protein LSP04_25020 [Levilactobacillus spicheri]